MQNMAYIYFSELKNIPRKSRGVLVYRASAAALSAAIYATPAATIGAPLSENNFPILASHCAPTVPVATLKAIASTESGLDPWALHDNSTGKSERPVSLAQAVSDAARWIDRGDSVDVGLMQINSSNLSALNMTVSSALDSCASLKGGAAVLRAAYGGGDTNAEQQAAMLMALSRYNTGSPFRGIMNGYARTVVANIGNDAIPALSSDVTAPLLSDPNAPASWDVSATGSYAQQHGATWLIQLTPVRRVNEQR